MNTTAEDPSGSWHTLAVFTALAVLWHVFLFWLRPAWHSPSPPPRVEVTHVDAKKLDAIRRQWKERSLLLSKNQRAASEAPADARFESDRNIRVEKEQRARITNVIPKSGPKRAALRAKGRLAHLGIPISIDRPENVIPNRAADDPRADQAILDKRLPEGGENLLNAQESVYYSFYARIYQAIGPVWQGKIREVPSHRRVVEGEYSTIVDVVVDANGNLVDIIYIQHSSIPEFDAAVESSWRRIMRFPNQPRGLLNEFGEAHTGWTFTVHVGPGFNWQYMPPERNY